MHVWIWFLFKWKFNVTADRLTASFKSASVGSFHDSRATAGHYNIIAVCILVGFFTDTFQSQRAGLASLVSLLAVGFILMLFVKEEQSVAYKEDIDAIT